MHEIDQQLDRRDFMKEGIQVTAVAAATVLSTSSIKGASPDDKNITFSDALPTRELGKTKVDFWDLSQPDGRITKVDRKAVACQVEKNLAEQQSDYLDAVFIHGTPWVEQMTVEQCMEVQSTATASDYSYTSLERPRWTCFGKRSRKKGVISRSYSPTAHRPRSAGIYW